MKLSLPISVYQMLDRFKISVFVVTKYQKSTLKEELTDFAVEDTASIDKIFLCRIMNN